MATDLFGNDVEPVAPPKPAPERKAPHPFSLGWDRMENAGKSPVTGALLLGERDGQKVMCATCRHYDETVLNDWAATVRPLRAGECFMAHLPTLRTLRACTLYEARQAVDTASPGRTGRHHPDTSRKAATVVRAGTQRAHALLVLWEAGRNGATAYEVSHAIETSPNQAATRMGELRAGSLARYALPDDDAPTERETTVGCTGKVHVLTEHGHAEASRLVNDARAGQREEDRRASGVDQGGYV